MQALFKPARRDKRQKKRETHESFYVALQQEISCWPQTPTGLE